jgi:hypothetical protein
MPKKSAVSLDVAPNDNDRPYTPCLHKDKVGTPMPPWPNDAWPWRGMIHPPAKWEEVPQRVRLLQVLVSIEMAELREKFNTDRVNIRVYNAHVKQAWAQFSIQFEWLKSMLGGDEIYEEMLDWDTDRRVSESLPSWAKYQPRVSKKAAAVTEAPTTFEPPDNFAGSV